MGYLGEVGGGLASALGPDAGHRLIEIICRLVPVRDRVPKAPIHAWGQPAAEQPILAGQQMDRLEHGGDVAVLTHHVAGPAGGGYRDPPGVIAATGGISGWGDEVPDHPWRELSCADRVQKRERLRIPQNTPVDVDPTDRLRVLQLLESRWARRLCRQPGARMPDQPPRTAGATGPHCFRCAWRSCRDHCAIPRPPHERAQTAEASTNYRARVGPVVHRARRAMGSLI